MAEPSTSVRLSPDLRARMELAMAAAPLGERSLNSEIVYQLQSGFDGTKVGSFLQALDIPAVVRMKCSSTSADLTRILNLLRTAEPEHLIFAARENILNRAVLVMVIRFKFLTVVIDGTWLNMARDHRESEVAQLFQEIDKLGFLSGATFSMKYQPETSAMTADEALATILATGPMPLPTLAPFLDHLSVHKLWDKEKFNFEEAESHE